MNSLLERRRFIPPAAALFLLSPVLAELVSGYLPPLKFFHPLIFTITAIPYGCAALLVRELIVRNRKGWISLVLLGVAFGLFFEGIVTRVLVNPEWTGLGEQAHYAHVFGFSWTYAVGIVHFQAVIAIICPVLLVEMAYPDARRESWIGTRTMIACGVGLPAWTFVLGAFVPFVPPLPTVLALLMTTALLGWLALRIPAEPFRPERCPPPSPLVFALIGGASMSLIMAGTFLAPTAAWRPPMPVLFFTLLLLAAAELALATWLNRGGARWSDRHRVALVAGYLGFFLVFCVGQDLESFEGRSLVSGAALWQLVRLWRKIGNRETAPVSTGLAGDPS
jgi:hypothetical protein